MWWIVESDQSREVGKVCCLSAGGSEVGKAQENKAENKADNKAENKADNKAENKAETVAKGDAVEK